MSVVIFNELPICVADYKSAASFDLKMCQVTGPNIIVKRFDGKVRLLYMDLVIARTRLGQGGLGYGRLQVCPALKA